MLKDVVGRVAHAPGWGLAFGEVSGPLLTAEASRPTDLSR